MLSFNMILNTLTKGETKQDARLQMKRDRGNGRVPAPTLRAGAYVPFNRSNPGGGQVDAGTIGQPGYMQPTWERVLRN